MLLVPLDVCWIWKRSRNDPLLSAAAERQSLGTLSVTLAWLVERATLTWQSVVVSAASRTCTWRFCVWLELPDSKSAMRSCVESPVALAGIWPAAGIA